MQIVYEIKKTKEQQIFDIALLAGTILMTSGAESYRVEDAVERILSLSEQDVYKRQIYINLFIFVGFVFQFFTYFENKWITKLNDIMIMGD